MLQAWSVANAVARKATRLGNVASQRKRQTSHLKATGDHPQSMRLRPSKRSANCRQKLALKLRRPS